MANRVPPELDALFGDYENLRDAVLAYCAGTVDDRLVASWHRALADFANQRTTLAAIHAWLGVIRVAIRHQLSGRQEALPVFWPPRPTVDIAPIRVLPMTRKPRSDRGIPRPNKRKP